MAGTAQGAGQDMSQVIGAQSGNLANILAQAGMSQADIQRIIAQSQAGAAQTAAGQFAGLPTTFAVQEQQGALSRVGQGMAGAAEGIGTAMTCSDYRMKDNISWVSSIDGINLYSWDWKPEFSALTSGLPEIGVIAQELAITHPDAVKLQPNGYFAVDYSKVM
jgi:hypothetical protein